VVGAELSPYFEVQANYENVEPLDVSDVDLEIPMGNPHGKSLL